MPHSASHGYKVPPQCCGSGSVFRSFLDPDPYSEYGATHANIGFNGSKRRRFNTLINNSETQLIPIPIPVYLHVLEMPHIVSLSSDPSVQSASDNIKIHIYTSVAEPPLFWAALAPEVRGPGADSGSDKMGRLRL